MNLADKYVSFQKIYGFGEGQMGFLKNLLNITGVTQILVFIKLYFPFLADMFLFMAPVCVLSYVIIGFMVGRTLDKRLNMVDKTRKWENKRDPAIKELLERVRRIDRRERHG